MHTESSHGLKQDLAQLDWLGIATIESHGPNEISDFTHVDPSPKDPENYSELHRITQLPPGIPDLIFRRFRRRFGGGNTIGVLNRFRHGMHLGVCECL